MLYVRGGQTIALEPNVGPLDLKLLTVQIERDEEVMLLTVWLEYAVMLLLLFCFNN